VYTIGFRPRLELGLITDRGEQGVGGEGVMGVHDAAAEMAGEGIGTLGEPRSTEAVKGGAVLAGIKGVGARFRSEGSANRRTRIVNLDEVR